MLGQCRIGNPSITPPIAIGIGGRATFVFFNARHLRAKIMAIFDPIAIVIFAIRRVCQTKQYPILGVLHARSNPGTSPQIDVQIDRRLHRQTQQILRRLMIRLLRLRRHRRLAIYLPLHIEPIFDRMIIDAKSVIKPMRRRIIEVLGFTTQRKSRIEHHFDGADFIIHRDIRPRPKRPIAHEPLFLPRRERKYRTQTERKPRQILQNRALHANLHVARHAAFGRIDANRVNRPKRIAKTLIRDKRQRQTDF